MNPEFPKRLAEQLKANPDFLDVMDDILLGELIFHYHQGELDADDKTAVEEMFKTNARAREILNNLKKADEFIASDAGKAWLKSLPDRVLKK